MMGILTIKLAIGRPIQAGDGKPEFDLIFFAYFIS